MMPFYGGLVYTGGVLRKHTHTHTRTAADTSMQMQTNTDWWPTAEGCTHAEHTLYVQGQHAPSHSRRCGVALRRLSEATALLFSAQTTAGIQLQCCLDTQIVQQSNLRAGVSAQITETLFFKVAVKSENNKNSDICSVLLSKILRFCSSMTALVRLLPSL